MLRIAFLLSLIVFTSACSGVSQNSEGKAYDANSVYCKQLWGNSHTLFRNGAHLGAQSDELLRQSGYYGERNQKLENGLLGTTVVTEQERVASLDVYDGMCESQTAYQERKEFAIVSFEERHQSLE